MPRVCGLETEFGCAVHDPVLGPPEQIVERIKDMVIIEQRHGLLDLHARGSYNPARSGGFLVNGGRLYVDLVGSHLEYATAECTKLIDLLAQQRASHVLLQGALETLDVADRVSIYNNSIDHFSGTTFGCHENYAVGSSELDNAAFFGVQVTHLLLPFMVTRQIWSGAGRVGGHRIVERGMSGNVLYDSGFEADTRGIGMRYGVQLDQSVPFQLSQRADHIIRPAGSRVRFNRSIINLQRNRNRLHILGGEANMSEYTTALKLGLTALVLDLLELDLVPPTVVLRDPLTALRSISRDQSWIWSVELADGRSIRAVDVQRIYLQAAQAFRGQDTQTDWLLDEWQTVLDALERDPLLLANRLDWVAKYRLLNVYMKEEGLDWNAEVLHSLDLTYHDINPETGLALGLEQAGQLQRLTNDVAVQHALDHPPYNTRAAGRAAAIRVLLDSPSLETYKIDWNSLSIGKRRRLSMPEPDQTYLEAACTYVRQALAN